MPHQAGFFSLVDGSLKGHHVPQKLIIDADPGIGDAIAIVLALLDPEVELLALTATAGCISGRKATQNVQAIVDYLDPSKRPRIGGSHNEAATAELTYAGADVRWTRINGPRGLGDWDPRVIELHNAREAAKLMIELVREYPNEITLLTLGPLTNVEIAAERSRDFLPSLRELVVLGGSVSAGGNVTAAAEFNMYMNPLAARTVLRSLVTKTLVPLDVTRRVTMTVRQHERFLARLRGPSRELFSGWLPHLIRANHELFAAEGLSLHEVVALVAAINPELVERASMAIDVETTGELTRGMTVFDRRGVHQWQTNIDVATSADTQGILDVMMSLASRSGR